MDAKPPSAAGESLWDRHRAFLATAAEKDVYVKLVVTADLTAEEMSDTCRLIADVREDIPLILQPVTPIHSVEVAPPEKLLEFQSLALKYLNDVRIIPQTHRIINVF